jgi:hypothetical protein
MQHNDRLALHRRQVIAAADFLEALATIVERTPGMTLVSPVQQPAMARQRVALNPPLVKEPFVGSELLAAGGPTRFRIALHRLLPSISRSMLLAMKPPAAKHARQRARAELAATWRRSMFGRHRSAQLPYDPFFRRGE